MVSFTLALLVFLASNGQPHTGLGSSRTLWTSADSLISMATMFLIFLLNLVSSFESVCGAKHETLCTSGACFTLHMDRLNFKAAHQRCVHNGGSLVTVRQSEDEEVLRSLVSEVHRHHQDTTVQFWIGLKLPTGDCVSANKALRGFKWVSGEEESQYSNWRREPDVTCTADRCVRVNYTSAGNSGLHWVAGSCKSRIFYACKFNFKEMCKPLVLMGSGKISYTLPFSEQPEISKPESLPIGTYAIVWCGDDQEFYSVCERTDKWSHSGPFCKPETHSCKIDNGGCQHECQQDADRVRCSCKDGYDLQEDGSSCRVRGLCHAHACEHQCVTSDSGYFCKCPQGFRLEGNRRNCSDVDECLSHACGGHLCENTRGSYTCVCRDGYEMADGRCVDVNECARSACQHGCSNSVGSFSCYCDDGFALSHDGRSCVDVDECADNICPFACVNTVGSFRCTCDLQPDTLDCLSTVTETPTAPLVEEENFTESLIKAAVELQHQSPLPHLDNVTHVDQQTNASLTTSSANGVGSRVIICVLGSVLPLLLLISLTLAIAIFRCSRTKKEAKKNATTDGYCWVSSGLDPRLEKLYESIMTDDP